MKHRTIKFTYEGKDYEHTFDIISNNFMDFTIENGKFRVVYSSYENTICVFHRNPIGRDNLFYAEQIK
ncbi:MAG: hypothetical protein LBE36_06490 [Flavobacteriaceae bacterium]|jgi:hypothetical protein|nr:hypothetical protein [Flavobacteriaceae bacterium]